METRHYLTVQDKGRFIRADYSGGAYIELTFGSERYQPTEVINVWSYTTGTSTIENTREALRTKVKAWIAEYDEESGDYDWYQNYMENR